MANNQPKRRATLSEQTRADRALYLWPAIYLVEATRAILPAVRRYGAYMGGWLLRGHKSRNLVEATTLLI